MKPQGRRRGFRLSRGAPMIRLTAGAISMLSFAAAARAGQTQFGWLRDTQALPQRGVELESWIAEEDGERPRGAGPDEDETYLSWSAVVGLTDRVELALPLELPVTEPGTSDWANAGWFGPEVRWRLTDPDPLDSGPFAGLLSLGVARSVTRHDGVRVEAAAVASADTRRLHFVVDLEGVGAVVAGTAAYGLRGGAGLSARLPLDLRVGAEGYAELGFHDPNATDWVAVGPNLAWTYGRFWLSAGCLIGLRNIGVAPRLNWAVAF